jgi:sugar lactone lactonase YvrE
MERFQAEVCWRTESLLGEGPVWNAKREELWWVDIEGCAVHCTTPSGASDRRYGIEAMPGCLALCGDQHVLVARQDGLGWLHRESGVFNLWQHPEPGRSESRFNDGKTDPQGNFWAGTTAIDHRAKHGALYRWDCNGKGTRMLSDVTISNGLAFTPEGESMYFIDTPTRCIRAFTPGSTLMAERTIVNTNPEMGYPDGMCIDDDGMLWVAFWDGACVRCFDPRNGRVLAEVAVPVSRPTSCVFGGKQRDTLYITSASTRMDPVQRAKEPLAGSLFAVRTGRSGPLLPDYGFAGSVAGGPRGEGAQPSV